MFIIMRVPGFRWGKFIFRAAGLNATSASGSSPGVNISIEPNCIWNAETPYVVPAGALISAGNSGKMAKSFPYIAVAKVNWVPIS